MSGGSPSHWYCPTFSLFPSLEGWVALHHRARYTILVIAKTRKKKEINLKELSTDGGRDGFRFLKKLFLWGECSCGNGSPDAHISSRRVLHFFVRARQFFLYTCSSWKTPLYYEGNRNLHLNISKGTTLDSVGKGHFYEESVNFYWNFVKGTTAKAQGIMAIAVGVVGDLEACTLM